MRSYRTRTISTRVTDEEYNQLAALAGSHTLSAWMHDALLAVGSSPDIATVLAELIALRTILLKLHWAFSTGQPITEDAMKRLIARADEDKLHRAHERLAAFGTLGPRRIGSPQP